MIFNERRPKKELTVVEAWKFNYLSYDNLRRFPEPDSLLFPQFRSDNQFFNWISADPEGNYLKYQRLDGSQLVVYDLIGAGWEKQSYRTVEFFGPVPDWLRSWLSTVAKQIL